MQITLLNSKNIWTSRSERLYVRLWPVLIIEWIKSFYHRMKKEPSAPNSLFGTNKSTEHIFFLTALKFQHIQDVSRVMVKHQLNQIMFSMILFKLFVIADVTCMTCSRKVAVWILWEKQLAIWPREDRKRVSCQATAREKQKLAVVLVTSVLLCSNVKPR
jgi:hypothetical protein